MEITLHKASFLKKNDRHLTLMSASFLFSVVNVFDTASYVCSFLDLISMNSIVPWYHPSILSFLILLEKERPDRHLPLFHSQTNALD